MKLKAAILALVLLPQQSYPPQSPGGGGGAPSFPLLAPAADNCTAPPYSQTGSTTTGLCSPAAGQMAIRTAGSNITTFSTAGVTMGGFTGQFLATTGTSSNPSYSFWFDTNTGINAAGADSMSFIADGINIMNIQNSGGITGIVPLRQILPLLGGGSSASTPDYSFAGDPNTGIYTPGADQVGLAAGGVLQMSATALGMDFADPGAKPTCDVTRRGRVYMDEGGVGVADTFEICSKDAADVYAWRTLQ